MKTIDENAVRSVKMPTREIEDKASVKLGGFGPSFPVKQRAANIANGRQGSVASIRPNFPTVRAD